MKSILLLILGVMCTSTSVIFIKLSSLPPVSLAASRLLLAALILTPFYFKSSIARGKAAHKAHFRKAFVPGIILALHFITWIAGARLTRAANATLIVNTVPLVIPFLAYFFFREKIRPAEIIGTLISLSGLAVLAAMGFYIGRETLIGDGVCFISMLFFSLYLILARKNNTSGNLYLYVVPLYLVGGLFCLIIGLILEKPANAFLIEDIPAILGLAFFPTVIGHSLYNLSMSRLRSQLVSLMGQGEFLFATLLAFIIFQEIPPPLFILSAGLVVSGISLIILQKNKPILIRQDYPGP